MRHIAEICQQQIPDILLAYLWQCVPLEDDYCLILLSPRRLGGGAVQDISIHTGRGTVNRTVFGFAPVAAALEIRREKADYTLSPAAGGRYSEEGCPCSA